MPHLPPALTSLLIASAPAVALGGTAADAHLDAERAPPEPEEARPVLGLGLDVGLPDGLHAALVWRPFHWLRLHGGGGYNGVGPGVRGGVTLAAFDAVITPTLTVEAGHFFNEGLDTVARHLDPEVAEMLPERASYSWASAHVGLEIGSPELAVWLRGGYSLIELSATAPPAADAPGVEIRGAAHATIIAPSAKLGLTWFFR